VAGWGSLEKSVVFLAGVLGIETAVILLLRLDLLTLLVSFLITTILVLSIALAITARRGGPVAKVLRDYGIPDGPQAVWHVQVKRARAGEEPFADSLGPFCTADLSRMQVGTYAPPELGAFVNLWACPACGYTMPVVEGKDRDAKGVALGRWNRREKSDWKDYRRGATAPPGC
jgi:hypothetical protein